MTDTGPVYPDLRIPAKVKRGPRKEYGELVLERIRALQRQDGDCGAKPNPCRTASGTWESSGKKILARIRAEHRRAK